jgi:hypothetical protein
MNSHIAIKATTLREWWGELPLPEQANLMKDGEFDSEAHVDMLHLLITEQIRRPTEDQHRAHLKNLRDMMVKQMQSICDLCYKKDHQTALTIINVMDGHLNSIAHDFSSYSAFSQQYDDPTWLVPSELLTRWARVGSPEEVIRVSAEMRNILDSQWFSNCLAQDDYNFDEYWSEIKGIAKSLLDGNNFEAEFKAFELLEKLTGAIESPYYDTLRCIPKDQL